MTTDLIEFFRSQLCPYRFAVINFNSWYTKAYVYKNFEIFFYLNWNDIFYNMDLNAMYETFLNILQSAMYRYIPRKRIYKNNNPAWFNKRLSNLKNNK